MKQIVKSNCIFNNFNDTTIGKYFSSPIISLVNKRNFIYVGNSLHNSIFYPLSLLKLNIFKASDGKYIAKNCKNIISSNIKIDFYNKKCDKKLINGAYIIIGTNSNPFMIYDKNTNNIYINQVEINQFNIEETVRAVAKLAINIAVLNKMPKIAERIVKFIENIPKAKKKKYIVQVGIDGELELVIDGSVTRANRYYSGTGQRDRIGVDGSGDPMEIRPDYGSTSVVVNSVDSIIKEIKHHISVAGNNFPIGCHVHFSVKGQKFDSGFDFSIIAKLLDFYLGKRCLGMNGSRRGPNSCSGYGRLSDIRSQFHGGFEYRVLPSSILGNKELFKLIISIGKLVVEKFVNGKDFNVDLSSKAEEKDYIALGVSEINAKRFIKLVDYSINNKERLFNVKAAWTEQIRLED